MIRLLLAAISLAGSDNDSDVEHRLMSVLLMVLIRNIAPCLTGSPALAEMAVKLVTQIASGPASAAFKAVVTTLPPQDKLKLQVPCPLLLQCDVGHLALFLHVSLCSCIIICVTTDCMQAIVHHRCNTVENTLGVVCMSKQPLSLPPGTLSHS